MKIRILLILALAWVAGARAQCSEFTLSDSTEVSVEADEFPPEGISAYFWYHASNPGFQDETITLILRLLEGPEDWTYQICRGDIFCLPIFFGDMVSGEDLLVSETECDYDVEVITRSHGSALLEVAFVREFCPEDTLSQELAVVATTESAIPSLAADFELRDNWPNPFNPVTHIPYLMPAPGPVTIRVLDLGGRTVALPAETAPRAAGRHEQLFDASGLPSGAYYYTVETPWYERSGKMLLLR